MIGSPHRPGTDGMNLPDHLIAMPGQKRQPSAAQVGEQVWLTLSEAAVYMRVSYRTVQRLVETRRCVKTRGLRFPCVRRGQRWLIKREELDQWLLRGER
ncbi:MAG: helix-turn-helix domain-containing protein [Candidatus Xenobia bacterium]